MKNGFMSVNAKSGAGRAFLRSLYQQYADWGVDFGTPISFFAFPPFCNLETEHS